MPAAKAEDVRSRAATLKLLLFDVDGVFTDGGVLLGSEGHEAKRFDIQDGMGVTLARLAGLRTGILTGRTSEAVSRRADELRIDEVVQGAGDKLPAYRALLESTGLEEAEVAYMGDALQGLPVLPRAGLAMAPANARAEVRERCHLVTTRAGGAGAVREAIEEILRAREAWDPLVHRFLEES